MFVANISFAASGSPAGSSPGSSDSLRLQIETLLLDGKRDTAIQVIKDRLARKAESADLKKSSTQKAVLIQQWSEITQLFLHETSQVQYSLAQSVWMARPKEAVDILKPLAEKEIGQVLVLKLLLKAAVRGADCESADSALLSLRRYSPSPTEIKLMGLLVEDCRKSYSSMALTNAVVDGKSAAVVYELQLRKLTKDQADRSVAEKILGVLQKMQKDHPKNPELSYWKWKISSLKSNAAAKPVDLESARAYKEKCAALSQKIREEFSDSPFLCLGLTEVEAALKGAVGLGV